MDVYVTFSEHVKNTIVALHESPVNVYVRGDGAFLIEVGDNVEATDYEHLISTSEPSWFLSVSSDSQTHFCKGVAHLYPRLTA